MILLICTFFGIKNRQIYRSNTVSINEQAVANEIYNSDVDCEWNARTRLCFSDSLEEEAGFVWEGSHLLQEIQPDGRYTYLYTDPDSYEPLAQVRN